MVEEALRDPISVGMLALDGKGIMEVTHETPGPRIGWILHALLEEVLEDPAKNTLEYLHSRAVELSKETDATLKTYGDMGKKRKEEEEALEIKELRRKNNVV
jgi:hypothetical protein